VASDVVEERSSIEANAAIYPNPSNGEFFNLNVTDVVDAETINVEIFDVFGKLVQVERLAVNDGNVNRIIELEGDLTSGVYLVNIVINGKVQTERLAIQR